MTNDDENEIVRPCPLPLLLRLALAKTKKFSKHECWILMQNFWRQEKKEERFSERKQGSLRENKKRREKRAVAIQNKKNCYIQLSS